MESTAGSIGSQPPHTRLHVHTRRLDDNAPLIEWTDPAHPTVFLRSGEGIVGFGEAHSIVAHDLTELAGLWADIASAADITDDVRMPGTGLVAFGSFAFSPTSAQPSVLSVPSVIVGRRGGVTWVTRVRHEGDPAVHARGSVLEPVRSDLGSGFTATLEAGAQTEAGYVQAVTEAIARIGNGVANKVVLARDLRGIIPLTVDLRTVIERLARTYPDTFTFAVDGLIGSSPETLVTVHGGTATARVLAGTSARGVDDAADALAAQTIASSPKDLSEHEFAVRTVLSSLAPHGPGFRVEGPYALRLPNLWHLASDVSGELTDGSTALDLVAALHPTAAVAGSPTDVALETIAELEPFDRGRYAGPVGWVDANGDGEWAVALRCARFEEGRVTAFAGAGIVADSVPARELAETKLKFRPIVDALGD